MKSSRRPRPRPRADRPPSARAQLRVAPAGEPRWVVPALGAIFALSGAAGLVHEVVWGRLLAHLFGASSLAHSTVLAAFMGGLALGSWAIGGRVDRLPDRRRAYTWLEIGIGVSAVAVPVALWLLEPLYGELWRRFHFSFAVFSVIRLLLAGALLLLPTMMMGATLPVMADYLARLRGRRLAPQWLYTLNLAGAVFGAGAAGFWLMPALGLHGTIAIGAALNVAAGLAALSMPALATQPAAAAVETIPPARRLILVAAFCSGAMSFATQVAWTRVLVMVVGSTTYAFTTVLLVYLVALAFGSAWVSRRRERAADVGPALAVAHLAMAGGTVAAVWAVSRLPHWYAGLAGAWQPGSLGAVVTMNTLVVFALLFVPVLFAGMIFPLAMIGALPESARGTGAVVGRVYAVNTVGAILGAVLGGFVLLPTLGSQRLLLGVALGGAVLGVVFAFAGARRGRLAPASVAVAAVIALAAFGRPSWPTQAFSSAVFEVGRVAEGTVSLDNPIDDIIFYREGPTATAAVIERAKTTRFLTINGRPNASNSVIDMPTQLLLAQAPLLVAPNPRDVFIVGWGSGITAGSALQTPVERVTAVELEPAVVQASQLFVQANHDALHHPKLRLYQDDARHILLAADDQYDVIISEPSHPWITGVADLFTRDFFALASRRLRDDGVFSQWLQGYLISPDVFRSILASFQSVFPEVVIYSPSTAADWILLGSRRPIRLDLEKLAQRWQDAGTRAELARIDFTRPEHFIAGFFVDTAGVRKLTAGAAINTDDNMHVEFLAPREALSRPGDSVRRLTGYLTAHKMAPDNILSDPATLLGSRERVQALIEGLELQDLDASRYRKLLATLP